MINIIDLGIGNIGSVSRALKFLKFPYKIVTKASELESVSKLILPGVGSFSAGIRQLEIGDFKGALNELVIEKQMPIIGICLGMQLLASRGIEGGESQGLGFIDAQVLPMNVPEKVALPHVGWNDVQSINMKIFSEIPNGSCFYFVHSYEVLLNEKIDGVATSEYEGHKFLAGYQKNNICGVQFHPEKSQKTGLLLLKTFLGDPC